MYNATWKNNIIADNFIGKQKLEDALIIMTQFVFIMNLHNDGCAKMQ